MVQTVLIVHCRKDSQRLNICSYNLRKNLKPISKFLKCFLNCLTLFETQIDIWLWYLIFFIISRKLGRSFQDNQSVLFILWNFKSNRCWSSWEIWWLAAWCKFNSAACTLGEWTNIVHIKVCQIKRLGNNYRCSFYIIAKNC